MVYFYWDASSSSTALYVEMEQLTRQWTVANRTVLTLRYQLDDCKAQVPLAKQSACIAPYYRDNKTSCIVTLFYVIYKWKK